MPRLGDFEAACLVWIRELSLHRAANDIMLLQRWYIRAQGGIRQ
jgi:hypothetical protein